MRQVANQDLFKAVVGSIGAIGAVSMRASEVQWQILGDRHLRQMSLGLDSKQGGGCSTVGSSSSDGKEQAKKWPSGLHDGKVFETASFEPAELLRTKKTALTVKPCEEYMSEPSTDFNPKLARG